jgi:hypothetical protein
VGFYYGLNGPDQMFGSGPSTAHHAFSTQSRPAAGENEP